MTLPAANWNYPTRVWFGDGRIAELPRACTQLGMAKPLLVTDTGLAELPMVGQARDRLDSAGIAHALFADVTGNPAGRHVQSGLAAYRTENCDGVIALGGGSALDVGKTIALMAGQTCSLWELEDIGDNWQRAQASAIAPVIAIPTTAGTGSEVGRAAVIVDEDTQTKKILFHPAMLPAIVISDPELTVELPANITAWTGMDALVHALEAYFAPGFHPMADGIAIEAVRMITQWLPVAVDNGRDLEARGQMLAAASMGATAFQKGLGCIHAVSHVLGALHDCHHGLCNAIILPYGLSLNAEVIDDRCGHLCRILGLADQDTGALVDHLIEFRQALGIPHTLREIGIDEQRAVEIGELALRDPSASGNPRALTAVELEQLFRAALDGDFQALQLYRP